MPKKSSKKPASKNAKQPRITRVRTSWKSRFGDFMTRRPHRSFRMTQRSSMPIHGKLPSYLQLSIQTLRTLTRFKRPFLLFAAVFAVLNLLIIGLAQQENYQFFSETIKTVGNEVAKGDFGAVTGAATLFGIAVSGGLNGSLSDTQQFALGLTAILVALSIVWFLRHELQGKHVGVREALYNSGAPILPAIILTIVATFQMIPAALGALFYSTVSASGISGIELMMFAVASTLLIALSLYWVTSTFFAGIIITIPGTYPFRALKLAGDIVIGRRLSMLLRTLWLGLLLLVIWAIILIPILLLAGAIQINWLPIVPVTIQVLSAFTLVYSVTYFYLLYRRMLDEPERN